MNFGEESEPKTIDDHFSDLINTLELHFPEGNVGEHTGFYLHSQYVGRDNKRRIVLFVTHGKPDISRRVTRVTYILPVPATGARIFNLEGAQPATAATFDDMAVSADQDAPTMVATYAVANNIAPWHAEVSRIHAMELATPAGRVKTKLHNLGIYWRGMQRLLFNAVAKTNIQITRSFSDNQISSSNRRAKSHRTSNVRSYRSSSSVKASAVATGRRTSSRRTSSAPSQRATRGRSKSTSDPRKPPKKPNSDPA